ncbi:hypothetical protein GCK72_021022 [Caenorhabditis remanei]|uniref:Peptidase M13 C-terminal domain-containing protein n=1 Tax=Caenorhabditis remanei TaxID=31234 RepID=A0A6A5GJE6_CAERE|nr:hypothetical protein GCK72_021022 [Caenorhabditis remanei]KAF1754459.1 hypothetical protein GCK72_021022 [Caenorhabditis remanei]
MPQEDKETKPHHPLRSLTIFLIWIFALYVAVIIIRGSEPTKTTPSRPSEFQSVKHNGVCKSPECILLAHQLHNWRDVSVDPCQNFYKAVCGKYNEDTLVDGHRMMKKTKIVEQLLKEFLEQPSTSTSKSEKAMKTFYKICQRAKTMNETEYYQQREVTSTEISKRIGSIPFLDKNWTESSFDLNDMISNYSSLGRLNLGLFMIPSNYRDVFIGRDLLFSKEELAEVKQMYLNDNKTLLDVATFEEDFKNMETFNEELEKFEEQWDLSSFTKLSDLQAHLPSLDFERILKNLFSSKHKDEVWETIRQRLLVPKLSFFFNETYNLETILQTTSKRVLANYFGAYFRFLMEEDNRDKPDGNVDCAKKVIEKLPLASLRVFARNHFDKENLRLASDMVEDIRQSFVEIIQQSTWLSQSTKIAAIRKIEHMQKLVGYPNDLEVPGALDSYFDTLNLSEGMSYLAAEVELDRFHTEQVMNFHASLLSIKPDEMYVETNAYYMPELNKLTINVALLDEPFFDSTYPKYAKVASIGEVIGHEIGHGFDPFGRMMDENGGYKDWWTPEDSAEYDRRAQCLIDQYTGYDDPDFGRNLNGSITIGEMAADLLGINVSWKTYKKVDFSSEPSIFGFEDEKPDKLFFHMTALTWCRARDSTPLATKQRMLHPTSSFRVNGVFSNMKEFAEAFNCPVGSPMNPVKKCELF